jgi:hypothetical protein
MTKHTNIAPATPLPWFDCSMNWVRQVDREPNAPQRNMAQDSLYAAAACNAYPKLVEALREAINSLDDLMRAPKVKHFRQEEATRFASLLRELGEVE